MLRNHINDNLSCVSIGFHVSVSLCNVLQVECAVNHWSQRPREMW